MVMHWQTVIPISELFVCIIFASFVYSQLGSFKYRPWYVTVLTLLGWICCFYIVFLVANDVAQAAQCQVEKCTWTIPATGPAECTDRIIVPQEYLTISWQVVYWLTLFLTWGVYPILQTYATTGEFTFGDKLRTSIRSNLLLYSVMAAVLIVVGMVTIISFGISFSAIPSTLVAAANAYGLFLLIAMLGHGLVNVPRRLWRSSLRQLNLKRYQFDIAVLDAKLLASTEELSKTLLKVKKAAEITSETDSYRQYIDIIISKCPESYNEIPYGEGNIEISYPKLALLHERLMRETHAVKMYRSMYEHTVRQGLKMEDVLQSKSSKEWRINWAQKPARVGQFSKIIDVFEYVWYCYVEARFKQLMCLLAIGISVVVVWSELLFFVCEYDLSIFSLYIRAIGVEDSIPVFFLQISIFLPVVYIAWCAYSSLFKLRLFNYYHIVPHHMSDSNSLLFSAAYLCRLTAPMAYNFMQMAHYKNTAFVSVMGDLDISGIGIRNLGTIFQKFFPVLLLPFILMTLFDVYTRILNLLHIKRFQFTEDFNHTLIEDGQEILTEERNRISRRLKGLPGDINSRASDIVDLTANSRGVSFNRTDEAERVEENDNIEASVQSSLPKPKLERKLEREPSFTQRMYSKFFGSGEAPRAAPSPPAPRSSRPTSARTTRPSFKSSIPKSSFSNDDDDNVWSDFDDKIHPL